MRFSHQLMIGQESSLVLSFFLNKSLIFSHSTSFLIILSYLLSFGIFYTLFAQFLTDFCRCTKIYQFLSGFHEILGLFRISFYSLNCKSTIQHYFHDFLGSGIVSSTATNFSHHRDFRQLFNINSSNLPTIWQIQAPLLLFFIGFYHLFYHFEPSDDSVLSAR